MALAEHNQPPEFNIPEWTLGDRLAKSREERGLEQEHMARLFGVSKSAVSAWERDESQPRRLLDVITRWAAETRVPRAWLLGEEARAGSRWFPFTELHGIPGGRKSKEMPGQLPIRFLSLA